MPNNSELKKALEKAGKQIVVKNKQIEELNAKLSHLLYLEELNSQKASIDPTIDIEPKPAATENKQVSKAEAEVQTEIVPATVTHETPETPIESEVECVNVEVAEESTANANANSSTHDNVVKKRSRSIWRLYLW